MRRVLLALVCVAVLGLVGVVQSAPPSDADDVIAITKAQWAAAMRKDVASEMKNLADDYTEFNPDYPTRLDGKALATKLAEAQASASSSTVASDMANAKVQLYGDVTILTYNYIGATKDKDGKVEAARAKSTRVYVRKGGQWWLVHANFAPAN